MFLGALPVSSLKLSKCSSFRSHDAKAHWPSETFLLVGFLLGFNLTANTLGPVAHVYVASNYLGSDKSFPQGTELDLAYYPQCRPGNA